MRLYYDIVVGLKAQLEQGATVGKNEEQELADLEESLASGGGGGGVFDAMSLTSDETSGAQVAWAGGACDGLVYESVDELRVAVESLQVSLKRRSTTYWCLDEPGSMCSGLPVDLRVHRCAYQPIQYAQALRQTCVTLCSLALMGLLLRSCCATVGT